MIDFTDKEIDVIKESLCYSKRAVSEGSAPKQTKEQHLEIIDQILRKFAAVALANK